MWLDIKANRLESYGLFLVATVAVLVRAFLISRPMVDLMEYTICDDMFYYVKIAQNFASGRGITFDQLTRTNGFHPLYFLFCSAVSWLSLSREATVRLIITFSALWGLLSAGLVAYLVQRMTAKLYLALLAFTLYALNPYIISQDLNGLETALYGFCLISSIVVYLALRDEPEVKYLHWIGLGCLVGLTLLARTESIFLPVVIMLDSLWLAIRGRMNANRWTAYILTGGVTLMFILPWVVWNLTQFGTITQDSARVFPYRAEVILYTSKGHIPTLVDYARESIRAMFWNVYILLNMLAGVPYTASKRVVIFFVVAPAVLLGFGLGRYAWIGGDRLKNWKPLGICLVYMTLLFVYYTFYHRVYHWRYFYSIQILFIPLAVGMFNAFNIDALLEHRRRLWVIAGLAVYLLASTDFVILRMKAHPWQRPMFQMAEWMKDNLPANARVGSLAAGIFGYWSNQQVVNIDGVVNNEILDVLKRKGLWQYIQAQKMEYICDNDEYITEWHHYFSSDFDRTRLQPVHVVREETSLGPAQVSLYKLLPPKSEKE